MCGLSRHTLASTFLMPAARMPTRRFSICTLNRTIVSPRQGSGIRITVHLTKVRKAIVREADPWAKVRKKLTLEGDSLMRPPRGLIPNHPFIDGIRMKDFVASVALTEEQICSGNVMRDFGSACRKMAPLVEFTTRALGLKF